MLARTHTHTAIKLDLYEAIVRERVSVSAFVVLWTNRSIKYWERVVTVAMYSNAHVNVTIYMQAQRMTLYMLRQRGCAQHSPQSACVCSAIDLRLAKFKSICMLVLTVAKVVTVVE